MLQRSARHQRLKILGIILSCLIACGGLFWMWMDCLITSKWHSMEQRVYQLKSEANMAHRTRPRIHSTELPGNSWEDYQLALDKFETVRKSTPQLTDTLMRFLQRKNTNEKDEVLKTLDDLEDAFAHMLQGARRMEAWISIPSSEPGLSSWIGVAAACQARRLAESGKVSEAVDLLLSALQFAYDECTFRPSIASVLFMNVTWTPLDELCEGIHNGLFGPAQLRDIETALKILDLEFEEMSAHSLRNYVAGEGDAMLRGDINARTFILASSPESAHESWRQLYSKRILYADAFQRIQEWFPRVEKISALPYAEELRVWREVNIEASLSTNPLTLALSLGAMSERAYPARFRRGRQAQVKLILCAVHFKISGEPASFSDPFGLTLHYEVTGSGFKVWSIGQNAIDDHGRGSWSIFDGPDIVLEVEK